MKIPRAIRTTILWMHLLTGVTVGLVVFVMSVTGVILAYERQMIEWADGYHVAPPTPNATPVSVETILANVRAYKPDATISNVALNADPTKPAVVRLGRSPVYVDPYSGAVLGEGSASMRKFVADIRGWHRWLAASNDNRALGKSITGASNLAFLFLVMSGFYLWWPRRWTWKAVKPVVIPSARLKGKPRDFNWHNSLGFWAAVPLFFIVLTGVFISYRWPRELTEKLLGAGVESREGEGNARRADGAQARGEGNTRVRGEGGERVRGEGNTRVRGEGSEQARGEGNTRVRGEGGERVRGEGNTRVRGEGGEQARGDGSTRIRREGSERTREASGVQSQSERAARPRADETREAAGDGATRPAVTPERAERRTAAGQSRGGEGPGGGGGRGAGGFGGERKPPMRMEAGQLDQLVTDAQRRSVGWKTMTFTLPSEGDQNMSFTVNRSENPRPDTREQLKLDVQNRQFTGITAYQDGPLSRRLTSWVRYLHTGEVFGVFGQTIAMLASLIGAVLVCTGLLLTWRRFRSWRKRRGRPERLLDDAMVAELSGPPVSAPRPTRSREPASV